VGDLWSNWAQSVFIPHRGLHRNQYAQTLQQKGMILSKIVEAKIKLVHAHFKRGLALAEKIFFERVITTSACKKKPQN
jgi:hypothetical protein